MRNVNENIYFQLANILSFTCTKATTMAPINIYELI